MCCLFGIIDCRRTLSGKQKSKMISILATECEERGTDATGIAYNSKDKLYIYKRPLAAHLMKFKIPDDAMCVMGHTRMTTQGSELKNHNNHPFLSKIRGNEFALAHNGVLYNDDELKITERLSKTHIETDSYVAVQLIEKRKALSLESLRLMAEKLEGSFTFTVLDNKNNLYFVRGDNPMCIYFFPRLNLYIYASTKQILERALKKMGLSKHWVEVKIDCGDILMINSFGKRTKSEFSTENMFWNYNYYPYCISTPVPQRQRSKAEREYIEDLKSVANFCGYNPSIVDEFINDGFTLDEVVEMLYNGDV